MSVEERSLDQVFLVQGSIRGYRSWDLTDTCNLESLAWRTSLTPHIPGWWYLAECYRHQLLGESPQSIHTIAGISCSCGFYAYYKDNATDEHKFFQRAGVITGTVRMSGRVILGSTGVMRAEKMQLEALFVRPVHDWLYQWRIKRALKEKYHVPVYTWMQRKKFLKRYPLEGVALPDDATRVAWR